MQLKILGAGNLPLLAARIKNLDLDGDAGLINWSAVCRKLGVKRSTFLSKVSSVGLDQALIFYVTIKKQRDAAAFLAACKAGDSNAKH